MVCDCTLPGPEDVQMGAEPCGEDCLNRLLMIEWSVYYIYNIILTVQGCAGGGGQTLPPWACYQYIL